MSVSPAETGLYYLNSRYYDPEVGRFINADDIAGDGLEINGYNMFSYCGNNPVVRVDDGGRFWDTIFDVVSLVVSVVDVIQHPDDPMAWLSLAGDAIDLVPFVSCVGETARAIKTTDNIADAVKKADRVADAVDDFHDSAKVVDNLTDSAKFCSTTKGNKGPMCFVAGTPVLTSHGYVAIEDIKVGDIVESENPETGEKGQRRVVQTFVRDTYELVYLYVENEEIVTTPEHPFWVVYSEWCSAIEIRAGDILKLSDGSTATVTATRYERLETPVKVYNFEVEDFHTYYVGNSSVLVHNTCINRDDIYTSVRKSKEYRSDFMEVKNGKKKFNVNNKELLTELNKHGKGWKKVYSDGYIGNARKSLHYFQDSAGRVFNVKYKCGWSVLK